MLPQYVDLEHVRVAADHFQEKNNSGVTNATIPHFFAEGG